MHKLFQSPDSLPSSCDTYLALPERSPVPSPITMPTPSSTGRLQLLSRSLPLHPPFLAVSCSNGDGRGRLFPPALADFTRFFLANRVAMTTIGQRRSVQTYTNSGHDLRRRVCLMTKSLLLMFQIICPVIAQPISYLPSRLVVNNTQYGCRYDGTDYCSCGCTSPDNAAMPILASKKLSPISDSPCCPWQGLRDDQLWKCNITTSAAS